jgi:two-component system, NarL family, sensor histidine kinase DesK
MNEAGGAAGTAAASRRAAGLVVAVLCLFLVAKTADGVAGGGLAQVPFAAALFVLPLLYALPATRRWWEGRRWWLLAAQAVLTYVPFAVFGSNWVVGLSGLLAGLVLLTVTAPASWLVAGALAAAEVGIRTGVVGLPAVGAWPVVRILGAYIVEGLALFGLARLADMVARVDAARSELAEVAVSQERARATWALQVAVGDRLAAVSARATAALQMLGGSPGQARELITEAGGLARQALADVRAATGVPDPVQHTDGPAGPATGAAVAPRLALTILAVELGGFWAQTVNNVVGAHPRPVINWATAVSGLMIVALQLYQSWPRPPGGRPPAWPWTLGAQALLVCGMFAALRGTLWGTGSAFAGFLAGSALLLIPGRRGQMGYGMVVASLPVLLPVWPTAGLTLTPRQEIAAIIYFAALTAAIGLLVYGLSWLAGLAVQLEELRAELAAAAVAQERARVARDTHDLLGLGLSAAALKTDLVARLIGRDDAAARAEIAQLRRICAAAAADTRLVTGGQQLSLDAELTQARELLVSAGITVRADLAGGPLPAAAEAVLVPVLREAVTNILRHSSATRCTIVTATGGAVRRLSVANDGASGAPAGDGGSGHGLANLTTRVEAAGGCLTSRRAGDWFELTAQIPVLAGHPGGDVQPAAGGSAREPSAT